MVVFSVAAICLLSNANGQQSPAASGAGSIQAQIKAARVVKQVTVTGQVMVTRAQGGPVKLKSNDSLGAGDVVITAEDSSVVLVFSNGSTVTIGQKSEVSVDTFTQDPFAADVNLSQAKEEPSESHTKLKLTYGELVGNVKHLNGKSTFDVETPVGAAGIRGTTFRLVYQVTGNGQAFFSLSTASGTVIFTGSTGTNVPISVGASQEVNIQVTIDDVTGAVQSVQVAPTATISDADKNVIGQQVTAGIESLGVTNFTALMQQDQQQQQQQQQQQDQQQQQQQQQQTTPGDGQSG